MGLFIAVTLVLGMDGMRPELASDLKVKVLILFVHHTLEFQLPQGFAQRVERREQNRYNLGGYAAGERHQ